MSHSHLHLDFDLHVFLEVLHGIETVRRMARAYNVIPSTVATCKKNPKKFKTGGLKSPGLQHERLAESGERQGSQT